MFTWYMGWEVIDQTFIDLIEVEGLEMRNTRGGGGGGVLCSLMIT